MELRFHQAKAPVCPRAIAGVRSAAAWILWGILFSTSAASAPPDFLWLDESKPLNLVEPGLRGMYLSPNEHNPQDAKAILERAPSGVYMSVGTERGFIGAALAPQSTHLLLVDRDPLVVTYNKINIFLLKAARDRLHYRHLRLAATAQEWKEAALAAEIPEKIIQQSARDEVVAWWEKSVRNVPESSTTRNGFRWLHEEAPQPVKGKIAFLGANYLLDDALFLKLQTMARNGSIGAFQVLLGRENALEPIARNLAKKNLRVAVLDISNAWWPSYITPGRSLLIPSELGKAAHPEGILLLTHSSRRLTGATNKNGDLKIYTPWLYAGHKFSTLENTSLRLRLATVLQEVQRFDQYLDPPSVPKTTHLGDSIVFVSDPKLGVVEVLEKGCISRLTHRLRALVGL